MDSDSIEGRVQAFIDDLPNLWIIVSVSGPKKRKNGPKKGK